MRRKLNDEVNTDLNRISDYISQLQQAIFTGKPIDANNNNNDGDDDDWISIFGDLSNDGDDGDDNDDDGQSIYKKFNEMVKVRHTSKARIRQAVTLLNNCHRALKLLKSKTKELEERQRASEESQRKFHRRLLEGMKHRETNAIERTGPNDVLKTNPMRLGYVEHYEKLNGYAKQRATNVE